MIIFYVALDSEYKALDVACLDRDMMIFQGSLGVVPDSPCIMLKDDKNEELVTSLLEEHKVEVIQIVRR